VQNEWPNEVPIRRYIRDLIQKLIQHKNYAGAPFRNDNGRSRATLQYMLIRSRSVTLSLSHFVESLLPPSLLERSNEPVFDILLFRSKTMMSRYSYASSLLLRKTSYRCGRGFLSATLPLFEKKTIKVPTMGDSITEVGN
jgi:hypothetical protein